MARASCELATTGVLHTARCWGTRAAASETLGQPDPLTGATHDFAGRARGLGVDVDTALAAVRATYAEQAATPRPFIPTHSTTPG
ncbi:hypothetical protein GCM10012275_34340 [Longimycelium tulufanense]|uniref:Uncharacterized protein n=1 Tax=Longimycelium tulufanense TaxID=907463 RepID=A0A8J3FUN5_9PSEU|nr:hypothetical protein [Longimycelium tulufanense]GGM60318.1 hypothetical protein GCM10012275_34340 [Longimycelium tulufanense]